MNGTIIVLNGTSSSGKSSLVRALQELLDEPFLDTGLDRFLWMLPPRYLRPPLWDEVLGRAVEAGPAGYQLVSGMHQAIAALSRAGCNVIADHVLIEPRWLEECSMLFSDLPAYLVGVHCPLAVVEERERQRKDRTLGQARAQFSLVHAHGLYDVEVDTSTTSPEDCAIRIWERLEDGIGPTAFGRLREMRAVPFTVA